MDEIIDNVDILFYIYSSSMNNYVYGMGETTIEDIKDFAQYALENIINENNLDVEILELSLNDSKINKNPHKDNDLNIKLYYNSNTISVASNLLYFSLSVKSLYVSLILAPYRFLYSENGFINLSFITL